MQLVTHQTAQRANWSAESMLKKALILPENLISASPRSRCARICFMASTEGGTEIEEVAEATPEDPQGVGRPDHRSDGLSGTTWPLGWD